MLGRILAGASVAVALAVACSSGGGTGPVPDGVIASVSVIPGSLTLQLPGTTVPLSARARDGGGVTLSGFEWTWDSENEDVAVVDESGVVTAVGRGTTSVVATTEGVTGSAQIQVTGPTSLAFLDGEWTVTRSDDATATTRFVQLTGGIREEIRTRDGEEILRALTRIDSDGVTWFYGRADGERRRMQFFRGTLSADADPVMATSPDNTARIVLENVTTTSFTLRIQAMVEGAWTDEITETYQR